MQGIGRAHDSLQGGKFPNHIGQQIGLAEQGGPAGGFAHLGLENFTEHPRQLDHPFGFLQHRAKFCLKDNAGEQVPAFGQRGLSVGIEEEQGILQSRPQYPLMALPADVGILHPGVVDRHKAGQQPPLRIDDRKVFLMFAHRGDQDLCRHLQEFFFETAADPTGEFDQIGDRIDKFFINGDAAICPGGREAHRLLDLGYHRPAPFRRIDHDLMFPQLLLHRRTACRWQWRGWP